MNLISKRMLKFYLLFFLTVVLLTYFSIYFPLKNALTDQVYENFELVSEAKITAIQQALSQSIQGAESLSSRTMIRDQILIYNAGEITWDELTEFTVPKYRDGAKVIRNLVGATRLVDGQVLASYGDVESRIEENPALETDMLLNDSTRLIIKSPILFNGQFLGTDIVEYDIGPLLESLNSPTLSVAIVPKETLIDNGVNLEGQAGQLVNCLHFDNTPSVMVFQPLNDSYYLHVSTPEDVLYATVNRITLLSLIAFTVSLSALFAGMNFFVVRMANRTIAELGESRDHFEKSARHDPLTGAFSRLYLDQWHEAYGQFFNNGHTVSLVMVDVDDFKRINDEFGHQTGDEVLIHLVDILNHSTRENDPIIRYGGDEFILLLENTSEAGCREILLRAERQLNTNNRFGFPIGISFGIQIIESTDAFDAALKQADRMMYRSKKDKFANQFL